VQYVKKRKEYATNVFGGVTYDKADKFNPKLSLCNVIRGTKAKFRVLTMLQNGTFTFNESCFFFFFFF
jgi:hypothetical protein